MQLTELEAHRHSIATRSGEISYIDIDIGTPESPETPERTGPVALFVHGIATNAFLWRNVIGALTTQRRCIAVDLPLHGRSPVTPGRTCPSPRWRRAWRISATRSGSRASISSPTTPAGPSRRSSPPATRSGWPRSP
jgi:hypothetical protein